MNKILEFINDWYAQLGFFLGVLAATVLLTVINPAINKPIIIENIVHDTIYITKMKTSYYNPVKKQCFGNPLITADGSKLHKNIKSVAVSRDLRAILPYGSKIKLIYPKHLSGIYIVNDCMNKRFVNMIDIMVWNGKISVDSVTFIKI